MARWPLSLVGAVALSLGAAGCGGGDGESGSLEDYFDRVVAVMDRSETESDAIQADMDSKLGAIENVDAAVEIVDNGLDDFLALATSVRNDLDGIEPPAEVAEVHREFVAVFEVGVTALEQIQADLSEIDTSDSPEGVLAQFTEFGDDVATEFGSLETESDVICFQMQDIADEHGIDIDLECEQ